MRLRGSLLTLSSVNLDCRTKYKYKKPFNELKCIDLGGKIRTTKVL